MPDFNIPMAPVQQVNSSPMRLPAAPQVEAPTMIDPGAAQLKALLGQVKQMEANKSKEELDDEAALKATLAANKDVNLRDPLKLRELADKGELSPRNRQKLYEQADVLDKKNMAMVEGRLKLEPEKRAAAKAQEGTMVDMLRNVVAAEKDPMQFEVLKQVAATQLKATLDPVTGKPLYSDKIVESVRTGTPEQIKAVYSNLAYNTKLVQEAEAAALVKKEKEAKIEAEKASSALKGAQKDVLEGGGKDAVSMDHWVEMRDAEGATAVDKAIAQKMIDKLTAVSKGGQEVTEALTPEGTLLAGELVKAGKPLPGGWSKSGQSRGNAILNQMAKDQAGGAGSGSIVAGQAEYKADAGSLANLTKRGDAIEQASKKIEKDIGTLKSVMDSGTAGGMKLLNTPINILKRSMTNNAEFGKYELALKLVATEYERLLTGGMLSSAQLHAGAQEDAKKLLSGDMTPEEVKAKLPLMLSEIENQKTSVKEQIGEIKGRMGGKAGKVESKYKSPADVFADTNLTKEERAVILRKNGWAR